jgi:hypothetical protein
MAQSSRINVEQGIVRDVPVEIDIPAFKFNWVFADESLQFWMVVTRTVVIEASAVVLASSVLE